MVLKDSVRIFTHSLGQCLSLHEGFFYVSQSSFLTNRLVWRLEFLQRLLHMLVFVGNIVAASD